MDADALFLRANELRSGIEEARNAGEVARVEELEAELSDLRNQAARAAFDVPAAQQELVMLRYQLRDLVNSKRASWSDLHGVGSPERQSRFAWPKLSSRPFYDDEYERLVSRIKELEVGLVAADAMGDIPVLDQTNETRW